MYKAPKVISNTFTKAWEVYTETRCHPCSGAGTIDLILCITCQGTGVPPIPDTEL